VYLILTVLQTSRWFLFLSRLVRAIIGLSGNIMKRTSSISAHTRKPTIVRVPANDEETVFTVEEAETLLKKEGFRPLSKKESIRFRKFRKPDC
jgi:hypothetical protein